ncbi:Uncharacterized protein OBRU01_02883 [Operophtera brumata]|uniref:Zinc finger BED domain-containing protein 4 n=1 Tax=Operophtera brumata TaxID=104452 RepID=A0A0L7LRW1_OPEBR|nr:Uncharacterized protein OBRU01_02883 [Operophtera brumata]
MTAHYIVEEPATITIGSDLLGCVSMPQRHTAENMSTKMKTVLDEYDLGQRVAVIVTDNAHNMTAALRVGGWRFWGCFAHSLNLIVQAGVKEIEETGRNVRAIVTFFRRSAHASAQLKATQERMGLSMLKLKIDVPTRWNSTMLMLQRFVTTKMAIISTMAIINVGHASPNLENITNTEWIVIEQIIELLEIFDIITQVISSEKKFTASTVILFHKQICRHLTQSLARPDLMPATGQVARKMQTECESRFELLEDSEMVAQSTILDPRFKKLGFIRETKYSKAIEALVRMVSRIDLDTNLI